MMAIIILSKAVSRFKKKKFNFVLDAHKSLYTDFEVWACPTILRYNRHILVTHYILTKAYNKK